MTDKVLKVRDGGVLYTSYLEGDLNPTEPMEQC